MSSFYTVVKNLAVKLWSWCDNVDLKVFCLAIKLWNQNLIKRQENVRKGALSLLHHGDIPWADCAFDLRLLCAWHTLAVISCLMGRKRTISRTIDCSINTKVTTKKDRGANGINFRNYQCCSPFYPLLVDYWSPTRITNRDKETESPHLVHPLTYRQFYLTKDAYFVEKIHCELLEMAWYWRFSLNLKLPSAHYYMNFLHAFFAFFLFYASWQEIRILVLFPEFWIAICPFCCMNFFSLLLHSSFYQPRSGWV